MGSTKIKLVYEGRAIAQGDDDAKPNTYLVDAVGDLLSFDYTDNSDGKVDDLQIELFDPHGRWRSEWLPRKGAKLRASILPAFGDGELVCGDMWIDEIECGGPPAVVTVRAVSVPFTKTIRGTKRTRAWESVTLEAMAAKMVEGTDLTLHYQGKQPVEIERADQHRESDLAFLRRLGEDYGFVVKVADGNLVVYDQDLLEDEDAVAVVDVSKGDGMVTRWGVRSKIRDVYRSARVMYQNPIRKLVAEGLRDLPKKEVQEPRFVAPAARGRHRRLTEAQKRARQKAREERAQKAFERKHDLYLDSLIRQSREEERREGKPVEVDDVEFLFSPTGEAVVDSVLEIEKRAKDIDEAKRMAERALRNANRDEVTLALDLVGDAAMRAGLNIELLGAGKLSGKYHVDVARHSVRKGYTTSVSAHKVLLYR